jgi:prepilin-type N-terminal cleavage/methylation domain-containing protein
MRNGFVLSELLIALVIISILALVAAPSFQTLVQENRATAAGESFYSDMELARSQALRKQSTVYVAVRTGTNWCYGLSDNGATCDCSISNSCLFNGVEKVVKSTEYPGVSIAIASGFNSSAVSFEGTHGTTGRAGQVDFASGSSTMSVAVGAMGGIKACSSNIGGYSPC